MNPGLSLVDSRSGTLFASLEMASIVYVVAVERGHCRRGQIHRPSPECELVLSFDIDSLMLIARRWKSLRVVAQMA